MKLPAEFTTLVKNVWGDTGEKWLEEFPAILSHCIQKWKLTSVTMHPDLSYNFIARAVSDVSGKIVLKIGVPTKDLETEISALQYFSHDYAVKLLDSDSTQGALLLEEITPAKPLHTLNDNALESRIAAQVIANIPTPAPEESQFPTVEKWAQVFNRIISDYIPESQGLPVNLVEKAKKITRELTETAKGKWLLHGDLHHDNILFDNKRGWLAIDPKGVIGDRSYECARFLRNPIPEFLSCDDPIKKTEERIEIFSSYLKEDRNRILGWAIVDSILGACWCIEDSIDYVDYCVDFAHIFERLV